MWECLGRAKLQALRAALVISIVALLSPTQCWGDHAPRVSFKCLISVPCFLGAHLKTVKVCHGAKWNPYFYKKLVFEHVKHYNISVHLENQT